LHRRPPVYPCGCFCSAQMPPKTSTRSTCELIDLVKTCENTLLAFDPTSLIVPTTRTRITANMTAYSAMSWPSSVLPYSPAAYNQRDTRTSCANYTTAVRTIRMRTRSIGNSLWVRLPPMAILFITIPSVPVPGEEPNIPTFL